MRWSILVPVLLTLTPLSSKQLDVEVGARAAILMNADTGAILFSKEAEAEHYPASVTKIATALYVLERKGHCLGVEAEASQEAVGAVSEEAKTKSSYQLPAYRLEFGGTHIGIKRGEKLSLEALLYGMMLASANDAANVLAEAVSGSILTFMAELNDWLRTLGCRHTFFTNPHGLHHPEHVTCALDLARLTQAALKHPRFREIVQCVRYTRPQTNLQPPTPLVQGNKLLKPGKYYYPHAIGVKTGYTRLAKGTLVAAADDGERTMIAVVMGCERRGQIFEDVIALFDAAYGQEEVLGRVVQPGPQDFSLQLSGAARNLRTYTEDGVLVSYYPAEPPDCRGEVVWDALELPVQKGQHVGEIHVLDGRGNLLGIAPLYAANRVGKALPVASLGGGALALVLLLGFYLARRRS